jgi:hypothetical protein
MGAIQNLRTLFDRGGSYWWLFMILPHKLPPKGDGVHYANKNVDRQTNDFQRTTDSEDSS